MELDVYQPTFLMEIEGRRLSRDITHEITSFAFEDNEEQLDAMEFPITDRHLQFVDDPLFQEGNEIVARFGYADDLSLTRVAVIKEIDYDFPDGGDPTIQIKAYDKGHKLAGKQIQRVWQKPAPEILYSEIARVDDGRALSRAVRCAVNARIVVEMPATVDLDGVHPERIGPLPDALAAFCSRQATIQKLLSEAYAKRSRNLLLQCLLLDPVVDSVTRAEQMLDLQREFLPEFA